MRYKVEWEVHHYVIVDAEDSGDAREKACLMAVDGNIKTSYQSARRATTSFKE